MFWDNLVQLCNKKGVSPNGVCASLGLSTATATKWKKGAVPRSTTLKMIADYIEVSPDVLIQDDQMFAGKENAPTAEAEEADELNELLEELKTRPEMRMLFSLAKGATKDDVELAVAVIERMRRNGGDGT